MLITAPSTSTVEDVKTEALDALTSSVLAAPNPHPESEYAMDEDPSEREVPKVSSKGDFELARAIKEKQRPTGRYETLDTKAQLKNVLANWEPVFIQFKDSNGEWCCPTLKARLHPRTRNSCEPLSLSSGVPIPPTQAHYCP